MNNKRGPCEAFKNHQTVVCKNKEWLPGSRRCRQHGGKIATVQDRAFRRGTLTEIVRKWEDSSGNSGEVELFPTNPFDLLQQTLNSVNDFQTLIKRKIDAMGEDEEEWRFTDKSGAEQLRSEISLYERALDRAVRTATAISKLNIEERYLAITEKQATSMMYILGAVLQRIPGITDEQKEAARAMVPIVIEEMLTEPAKRRHV